MAHAAPVYPAPAPGSGTHPTHSAHRSGTSALWAGLPLLLGVVYGIWASGIRRDGGPITTGNVVLGVVTGVIFAVVFFTLHRMAPALPRELRALSWMAFTGIAIGFLHSLTGSSVLWSVVLGLVVGAGVFVMVFYRYYTTE
ncbi:hypothetical protein ACFVYR_24725 [Streptomyces sp. NPDC058284]|uniref:hypothetical protein n=1 Tax=unclassified Streptomyces TaxID=2593676 RepID=UPI0036504677